MNVNLFIGLTRGFILGLMYSSTQVSAQEVYRWVDQDGTVKFSDQLPAQLQIEDVTKIKVNPNNTFKSVQQIAKEEGKTISQQQQDLEMMSQNNCNIANQNLKILKSFDHITQLDASGNEVALSPQEKEHQLSLMAKQAEIFCVKA
jgi:hypothetical protein